MINLKRTAKVFSFILAILLVFSPLLTVTSAAVSYPQGITKEQTASVIPKLNSLTKALLSSGSSNISTELYKTLFSDTTLNGLFSGIYEALGENADALSAVGVDISPAALSQHLSNYSSISKKIASCKDLSAVIKASKNFTWGISTKKEFANAVASMLAPFNALLNALLCSGSVEINSLIAIKGDDGYGSTIVPLLRALDCPEIMSSADFAASAAKNRKNIVRNIVDMLFLSIDALIADPVIGMCNTLPKVAYYIKSGKLSSSITTLLEPLSLKIAGFLTIPGISDLISSVADLEGSFNIEEMLGDFDISALLGSEANLQFPDIDLQALADCVTDTGSALVSDQADALIVILNFLADTIRLNKDNLGSLLGGSEAVNDMLAPLVEKSNDEIIKTVINLFSVTSLPANNYQWNYPSPGASDFSYTPNFKAEDYQTFLNNADYFLTLVVRETDPEGDIESTLRNTLYSNSLVSMLVKEVFGMLGSNEMSSVLSLAGLDISPAGIANAVYSYVPSTANYLYNFYSWERVNTEYLSWGFEDGDKEGFTKALTKILSPFIPLLSCLLAENTTTLMGAVTIPGSDGYNTAIIPLLEALGCPSDSIKTYADFKKGAGTEQMLTDILTPVCALLDELAASPIKTACRILPNIVYFFNSGLMNSFIENLIYPVTGMLSAAGLGDVFSSVFNALPETDLNATVSSLTSGIDLGITLPELDISKLGTLGTLKSFQSKRTVNGAFADYSYLEADSPAVFLTIMRYITGALSMEENSGLLTGLMASPDTAPEEQQGPDMIAMFTENIMGKLENMTADETVEWLCDLLFSDAPKAPEKEAEKEIPTIIYEKKFELSTTAKLLIVVGIIAALALTYYILSVSGKLDNFKLKRRKKQEAKRRNEEMQRLIKAGAKIEPEDNNNTTDRKPLNAAVAKPAAVQKSEIPAAKLSAESIKAKDAAADGQQKAEGQEKQSVEKQISLLDELHDESSGKMPLRNTPEGKLDRRQQNALKKNMKNQIKAQKIYEKAVQEANNKK